jgi:hypothetical protein
MRGLAEYVMSGRRQAATVVVLLGLIPMLNLLSGAVVALVTLRKGSQEGFLVMMWALLPAGLQWLVGDTAPVIMVVGVMLLANLLRRTQSWQQVLLVMTLAGLLLQLSLQLQPAYIENVQRLLDQLLEGGGSIPGATEGLTIEDAKAQMMALWLSFYGVEHMLVFTGCLMVGRFWQAMLYNPGGFRQEFYNLRIDPRVMGVLLVLMGLGLAGLPPLADLKMVFGVVPGLCGLAVAHHVVAARKLGTGWLVLTYLLALLLTPAIVVVGFADSWIDIRKRMT